MKAEGERGGFHRNSFVHFIFHMYILNGGILNERGKNLLGSLFFPPSARSTAVRACEVDTGLC